LTIFFLLHLALTSASALSIWPHLTYLVMDGESGELTE